MVVGEAEHVHAGGAAGRFPCACLAIACVPVALVPQMAAAAELPDVVDQRPRVTDAEAASAVDAGEGVARSLLIGTLAVIETKNVGEIVLRMLLRTDAAVILGGLQRDRVPRVLPALGLASIAIPFRLIKRLVVVPKAGDVDVRGVGQQGMGKEKRGAERNAKQSGGPAHDVRGSG